MNKEKSLKNQTVFGMLWKFTEKSSVQSIQFIVQIFLARLLVPSDYGIIGLITVFTTICTVFIESGLGTALIQKKDADIEEFSSVFYVSVTISIFLYFVLFIIAPLIASFYNDANLIAILRVLSLNLLIAPINNIQNTVLEKKMQFKKSFYRNLGSVICSGIVGVTLALNGFGVWALVGSTLTLNITSAIILSATVKWRPKLLFSIKKVGVLISFSWKLLCSSLLNTIYNNIYTLVIGKLFSKDILGYYNRGNQIPNMIVENINSSIAVVLFPAMSKCQDDREKLKMFLRRSILTSTFLTIPLMVGLAACAKPITIILLTEKWLPSVPFMQIICIACAILPIHTANLQAINAMGRSDIFLKLEIIKKVVGISILAISYFFGIYGIVVGSVASALICTIINAFPNKKLLNYSFVEQWKDIMPSIFLSVFMGFIVLNVQSFNLNVWITLVVQIIVGITIYFSFAKLFKFECLDYILNIVNGLRTKEQQI